MITNSPDPGTRGTSSVRQPDVPQLETAEGVLQDVYDLLELYAPIWYGDRLRERINSVLSSSGIHLRPS